jgi:WD40 repeat protein
MVPVPLRARLVEVIADRGEAAAERYRYGSGCIVRGRTVLTAAHVVAGAKSFQVRDPNKKLYLATVDQRFVGDPDGPGPDLALVEIDDPAMDLPPMGLARVDRDSPTDEPVERCHAIGYPWFAETPSPAAVRDTVDAIGVVPVLSKLAAGLLSIQVSISPRPLPPEDKRLAESEWSGMSGAPVLAAGRLLGVVVEHAPREGPSAITAVPLTALERDPVPPGGWGPGVQDPSAWWARLGVTGLADLQRLPALPERPQPAYWETLREFGRTLHRRMPQLLGREQDLAEIAAFATGAAGYRWLVGGAYAGKTALMYEAVTAGLPDEVDVVCYFLSRRASDADSSRFLAAVVPQLAYLCGLDPPAADRDQFYALWGRAAERAAETGRALLLVVDGLDEDIRTTGLPSVASLLPTLVEGRAHVLVASRPRPGLPTGVPDGHPLRAPSIRVPLTPFEGAERLAELARQEIYDLTHGVDADFAADALGLLTAAAGPLSEDDLAFLSNGLAPPSAAHSRRVYRLVTEQAARSLEPIGSTEHPRWQFAHFSLLEYAQATKELSHPEYRNRIHQWAQLWRDRRWPPPHDERTGTPRYLLDEYPATLAGDPEHSDVLPAEPQRVTALASDVGWVSAAIGTVGADRVRRTLRRVATAAPHDVSQISALDQVAAAQSPNMSHAPAGDDGYVLRHLCLQALEFGMSDIADAARAHLQTMPDPGPVPAWTTVSRRPAAQELGTHEGPVRTLTVLPNRRLVTGGRDGRVRMWDLTNPGIPVELGSQGCSVEAACALPDGRIVIGGIDGRVVAWDPANPGIPVELGAHEGTVQALGVLPDGRIIAYHHGWPRGHTRVGDLDQPGTWVELDTPAGRMVAMAVRSDGRVISSHEVPKKYGSDRGRVLIWSPSGSATPVEFETRKPVHVMAGLSDGRVLTNEYDSDDFYDTEVRIWDPDHPQAPADFGRIQSNVTAVAETTASRIVAVTGDGRVLIRESGGPWVELGNLGGMVNEVAALVDGRVATGDDQGRVLIWNSTQPVESVEVPELRWVADVAALPSGRVLTADSDIRGYDSFVRAWDLPTSVLPFTFGSHDMFVNAVALLPDGGVVTVGGGGLRIWDLARPYRPIGRFDDFQTMSAVAVMRDGRIVIGGKGRVRIWDPSKPRAQVAQCDVDGTVRAVDAMGDGRVVIGANQSVSIWDPSKPQTEVIRCEFGRDVHAVAVVHDARIVAGGGWGITIWDPSQPDAGVKPAISQSAARLAVLSDGRVVFSADRKVGVWDPLAPETPVHLIMTNATIFAVAAQAMGGHLIVVVHKDGFSGWTLGPPHNQSKASSEQD